MMAGSDTGNGRASSLTETEFMLAQPRQQGPAGRIRQRREGAIQRGCLILNHMVKYRAPDACCQVRDAMRVSSGTLGVLPPPLWGRAGVGGSAVSL